MTSRMTRICGKCLCTETIGILEGRKVVGTRVDCHQSLSGGDDCDGDGVHDFAELTDAAEDAKHAKHADDANLPHEKVLSARNEDEGEGEEDDDKIEPVPTAVEEWPERVGDKVEGELCRPQDYQTAYRLQKFRLNDEM